MRLWSSTEVRVFLYGDSLVVVTSTTNHRREFANLDLLRAVAVSSVVGCHLTEVYNFWLKLSTHPFDFYFGRIGVLLFFVHTSLVLLMSMERSGLRGSALHVDFYIRRIFRVYPLAIFCIAVVWLLQVPSIGWGVAETRPITAGVWIANLFLVQNLWNLPSVLTPLWTLPYEIQMYAVLPVIFLLLKRVNQRVLSAFVLWVLAVFSAKMQPENMHWLGVVNFVPCFLGGVVAWTLWNSSSRRLPAALWPVVLTMLIASYIWVEEQSRSELHPFQLGWVWCLLVGVAIPCFRELSAAWVVRPIAIIARYSYGIYLFHMIAIWIAFTLGQTWSMPMKTAVFFLLTAVASVTSHHLLEVPCMRLGSRIASRIRSKSING